MNIGNLHAVEIEINSDCNKSCSYCPNSVAQRIEKGQMRPELYNKIIDQLAAAGFSGRISYDFYNEPLLCKNLTSFTSITREKLKNSQIHLYSNGSLLSYEKFCELEEAGVTHFIITKHEDHFEKEKPYLFESTLVKLNDLQKEKLLYRPHHDLKLTNRGGTLAHIESTVDNIQNYPCFIPTFMMTITVNGTVLPCFEDFYQQHAMGNIEQESLEQIWNKPEYIKMRKALMLGQRSMFKACEKCTRINVMPDGNRSQGLPK